MPFVNKIHLLGRLGSDPIVRNTHAGSVIVKASLATSEVYRGKDGKLEHTEWHKLSFTGKIAETASKYLRKGSQIYVEGCMRTRKYTDNNGIDKTITEVRVQVMQMLGKPDKPE